MKTVNDIKSTLASPRILNYTLPVLMVYLFIGTVAQKYIGLYEATKIFFSSPIIWAGPLPLPGLPICMAMIFINLLFKILFKSPWGTKKSGIIITHIGALLLLLGGLFTALFSQEGFVDIAKGDIRAFETDYNIRELVIKDEKENTVFTINHQNTSSGQTLSPPDLPDIQIKILEHCHNCKITKRENADETYFGMAQHMQLSPDKLEHENERNMAGAVIKIEGSDAEDGHYVTLENVPKHPTFTKNDKTYKVSIEKQKRPLPFKIELLEFQRDNHPGTALAKSYSSKVRIHDGPLKWDSLISMNEPLRYKGYTIFQSSFIEAPEGDISVLSIVWNAGRSFPYISSLVMCLGLIIHLMVRRKAKPAISAILLILTLFFTSQTAEAAEKLNTSDFAHIPIMHEGRIKPMETFARSLQKEISGHERNALPWLIESIFNPAKGENIPAIKISNPDVLNMLSLSRTHDKLYAYNVVIAALARKQDVLASIIAAPQESWTPAQKDFINIQRKTMQLADLLSALSLYLPIATHLPHDVPQALKPYAERPLTYLDAAKFKETLQKELLIITNSKGNNLEKYTAPEKAIALLSFSIANIENAGQQSALFKVFPKAQHMQPWLTPWESVLSGKGGPENKKSFENWQALSKAYNAGDNKEWTKLTNEILQQSKKLPYISSTAIEAQYFYSALKPLNISAALYGITLFLLVIARFKPQKHINLIAFMTLIAGALMHIIAICMRIYILQRPPVSTLYESIIFVGIITVIYGILAHRKNSGEKQAFWLFLSAGSGVFFHILGLSHDQDGDSMMMLSAVLNTNFWLAVHVLCITAAYAFCIMTSILAHHALYLARENSEKKEAMIKNIKTLAIISLLLSTAGTILGGIWADQSWGRFWGWDPKENGALLIVLWLIWVLHARISGQMSEKLMIAGLAALSIIVALSWFGVNLLSVGLHAYGFTDSAAWTLGAFISLELSVLAVLLLQKPDKTKGNV